MDKKDDAIRDLMANLMRAVQASLATSSAVREALAELVRHGYEARLFFVANAESAAGGGSDDEEAESESGEAAGRDEDGPYVVREIGAVPDSSEVRFELTKLDRDFLKSLHIRPESG
ncbi:MAG: hypothetical protein HY002_06430 [Candidatus Rokubacteria bacterium]|nr:hypothetical protein [Candidatus Rokubacteria bacterium]